VQLLKCALDNSSKGLLGPLQELILRLPVAMFAMSRLLHRQDQMGLLGEVDRCPSCWQLGESLVS